LRRHPRRVLSLLVAGVVFALAGCGDDTTSGAPAPASTSGTATTAALTSATPTDAAGDLRSACRAAEAAIEDTIQQLFDHPNDIPFAAKVYAEGAVKLRKVGAGTPIEAEINKVAATFELFASELERGEAGGDTGRLPRAGEPLQRACT
jgi:hypothetical protein